MLLKNCKYLFVSFALTFVNLTREICKLTRASTFLDFKDEMSLDMIYR